MDDFLSLMGQRVTGNENFSSCGEVYLFSNSSLDSPLLLLLLECCRGEGIVV